MQISRYANPNMQFKYQIPLVSLISIGQRRCISSFRRRALSFLQILSFATPHATTSESQAQATQASQQATGTMASDRKPIGRRSQASQATRKPNGKKRDEGKASSTTLVLGRPDHRKKGGPLEPCSSSFPSSWISPNFTIGLPLLASSF